MMMGDDEMEERGVVYLSTLPLYMKPLHVKELLSQHGTVTNMFLVEEDEALRKQRAKQSSSSSGKRKRYIEGWVEFSSIKDAKTIAEGLNTQPVTNKRRKHYSSDLWSIKYLPKFKWEYLREKQIYEKKVYEQKLRAELSRTKASNEQFLSNVEKSKTVKHILKKQKVTKPDE